MKLIYARILNYTLLYYSLSGGLFEMSPAVKSKETRKDIPKALTGIKGFDDITFGGLPRGRPSLVAGGAGSGKTMFCMEFIRPWGRGIR